MKKASLNLILASILLTFGLISNAQTAAPDWSKQTPQRSGYLYAVGVAKSSDASMAHKKARTIALTELSKNYSKHFESISKTCDTIAISNNIRTVISTMKTEHEASFVGVEEVEKVLDDSGDLLQVYLLIRIEIKDDIKTLKKAISEDKTLSKKSSKARLSEELDKL